MRSSRFCRIGWAVLGWGALTYGLAGSPTAPTAANPKVEFNRDIRPVLSKCSGCHGPTSGAGMAGLRVDMFDTATRELPSGRRAIVPGHPEQSELIRRIRATGPALMPPVDSHKTLSTEEKDLLEEWIREGAVYKEHWAFLAPEKPELPLVRNTKWVRDPLDRFVLARLEEAGVRPEPEAAKATLLRRLSLDLIGLPPTPAELDAFLADTSPTAYEKVVDRLLASPRYGERMAMEWMDIARYADSNGYQADFERYQYRWRDWVIQAFNQNMPYDAFTVEQIAGDMLPNATFDQKLATGFGRNHRINTEGGVIVEEWRVETVIDRVETVSAAWLGLTTGCARCHDHKYDPVSQREFYQLFAYFNNVPESGSGEERAVNHPPVLRAPYPEQTTRLATLVARETHQKAEIDKRVTASQSAAQAWVGPKPAAPTSIKGIEARYNLSATPTIAEGKVPAPKAVGPVATDFGRSTGAVVTKGDAYLDLGQVGDVDSADGFSYGAWIYPEDGNGAPIARMDTARDYRGWDLTISGGVPMVHLIDTWPGNALKVLGKNPIPLKQWSHVFVTVDGSRKPEGIRIYVNGKVVEQDIEVNALKGSIRTTVPLTVGRRTGANMFTGKVDDLVVVRRAMQPAEVAKLADVHPAARLVSIPGDTRTPEQKMLIARFWLQESDPSFKRQEKMLADAGAERMKVDGEITTVMVMEEMPKPRDAFLLLRGEYDKHGEKVEPGVPSFLPGLPTGVPNNRLGFARWVVSPENPLTSRVTVNRLWERFFGVGIVASSEDMGTRAEYPSHPELLDYLAAEFVEKGWDLKGAIRQIVTSATYRQSSDISAAKRELDPENRLLSRGPRFRLPGEVIRDQALFVSGLLVNKIGGPSVRPYQPKGIWDETNFYGNLRNYEHDKGDDLYRRSLYTIWKRTAAPPNMLLFDVPSRETCRVRRARTDTPLQALVLMNDPTFVEAARVLAQNVMLASKTPRERLTDAFVRVLARKPTAAELSVLERSVAKRIAQYKADPKAALGLISVGDSPVDPRCAPAELAAYTVATSTLLNLDETINKD